MNPRYRLYGVSLDSPLRLPAPSARRSGSRPVRLHRGEAARFARVRPRVSRGPGDWFQYRRLPGGDSWLRWEGLFEFLVSADGRRIDYQALPRANPETLSTYLLGQVLSFALLALGEEPLHATVVVVDGRAVALLGDCGYGKSTLGAAFLRAGHPILTDDLLALKPVGAGYQAHPGIPRIKLFPDIARGLLGRSAGTPLNPGTSKRILRLAGAEAFGRPAPLEAIYVLAAPARGARTVSLAPLSRADALLEIVRNTFNTVVQDTDRLARQFRFASRLAARVPVIRLAYPRKLAALPAVVGAVLADLA